MKIARFQKKVTGRSAILNYSVTITFEVSLVFADIEEGMFDG